MNEDRTVEDNVGGQQVGESSGRWLRATHVFERMTCQANSLGALETAGYSRAEVWRLTSLGGVPPLLGRRREPATESRTRPIGWSVEPAWAPHFLPDLCTRRRKGTLWALQR